MDNRSNNVQDLNSVADTHHKNEIALPLIALGLDLLPVLLIFLGSLGVWIPMSSLVMILSPIAGLLTGISALSLGKARIGPVGKTLAIIAIALPLALVALIVLFFIGAVTGIISLM